MRTLASLLLLLTGAGCAASEPSRRPVVPRASAALANTHDHDCVAAAESAWTIRERKLERENADNNAFAMPNEPKHRPASDLEPFDEKAAKKAQADLATTSRIRRALLDDASLSFAAKNVKILTRGGKVVLRGAVKDARERSVVETIAEDVAGDGNVENLL